jgi:RNA 2',3'-cyclic 3'-phosphodiesterase
MRLFLALWPDERLRDQLQMRRDAWVWPASARPVPPQNLHLTLHFLGEVADHRVEDLDTRLRLPFSPFALNFGRDALWHNGVAVLEPEQLPQALMQLHARLGTVLTDAGVPVDQRAYRPHVTLARHAGGSAPPTRGQEALQWHVDSYVLVATHGDRYSVLQRFR